MRLFVAVAMPAALTSAIDIAVAPSRARFPEARWVPSRDRHVTLKYLGSTPRKLEGWVHEQVREVATSWRPFDITLAGLGGFPLSERARIVWVGVDDPDDQLEGLSLALGEALSAAFPTERRPFTPHISVARSDRDLVLTGLTEPERPPVSPLPVREIVLYSSHAGGSSPRYEALAAFAFGR